MDDLGSDQDSNDLATRNLAAARSTSINKAEGYFDLGLYEEAWGELDDLDADARISRPVMSLRLEILRVTERWDKLGWLAEGLTETNPRWPEPWFHLAACRAKEGQTEEAEDALRQLFDIDKEWRLRVLDDDTFEPVWNRE